MTTNVVTHEYPIWRERANFIVTAKINSGKISSTWQWEQLWAKKVTENRFEICCIPFFIYNLALGDEVETGPNEEKRYVIQRVLKPSGRYTFRAWFHNNTARVEVYEELTKLGCLMEWRSPDSNLLAIDVVSDSQAQVIADFLWLKEQQAHLTYETGRT